MKILEKFKNIHRDTLIIILTYDGRIKYNKGIYTNIIIKNDYRYNLIDPIINKKINIISKSNKKNINSFEYLKVFQRSFYYNL